MLTPCINICKINEQNICIGCFRTLNEIAQWTKYSDLERTQIINRINDRTN